MLPTDEEVAPRNAQIITSKRDDDSNLFSFMLKVSLIGILTGISVVALKSGIQLFQSWLYEDLASILPNPSPYYPLAVFPTLGSLVVCLILYVKGKSLDSGIPYIAASHLKEGRDVQSNFAEDMTNQVLRSIAAVATLGSGCSLGPEGPAVELATRISSFLCGEGTKLKERKDLFLAAMAAGVSAGFNAPIAGILFAIECGPQILNTASSSLLLSSSSSSTESRKREKMYSTDFRGNTMIGLCLAACFAKQVVQIGLHEANALSVQGNLFAMEQPALEIPLYLGLGMAAGITAVVFNYLLVYYRELFSDDTISNAVSIDGVMVDQEKENRDRSTISTPIPTLLLNQRSIDSNNGNDGNVDMTMQMTRITERGKFSSIPTWSRPLLAGSFCGVVSVFAPQTLFVGYQTLDQLLAGTLQLGVLSSTTLLSLKLMLTSFSIQSGLVGGTFAPSLYFGAMLGTAYHDGTAYILEHSSLLSSTTVSSLANAPAYATVGSAAVLAAMFNAPLMSSILMLELTENHDIVLPLLVSAATSSQIALLFEERDDVK